MAVQIELDNRHELMAQRIREFTVFINYTELIHHLIEDEYNRLFGEPYKDLGPWL